MQDQLAKQLLDQVIQDKLVAGIDDRGNPIFPLTQGEMREFIERRMDERRLQQLLRDNPGSGLINIMNQQGLPIKGV
jgi:ribosomal protein S3AE